MAEMTSEQLAILKGLIMAAGRMLPQEHIVLIMVGHDPKDDGTTFNVISEIPRPMMADMLEAVLSYYKKIGVEMPN